VKDAEVSVAFNKYYMQKVTEEFADDLDHIRSADDFKDKALVVLVNALQQGMEIFSKEEQRRIVMAGRGQE
jgi:ribosome assembly protein 3